jgi:hypothetical protein
MRFQYGIGWEFRADERCQFGVWNWSRKWRGDRARRISVYRLTTIARTSIEIIGHRIPDQV